VDESKYRVVSQTVRCASCGSTEICHAEYGRDGAIVGYRFPTIVLQAPRQGMSALKQLRDTARPAGNDALSVAFSTNERTHESVAASC
jgi:hypothetical protein